MDEFTEDALVNAKTGGRVFTVHDVGTFAAAPPQMRNEPFQSTVIGTLNIFGAITRVRTAHGLAEGDGGKWKPGDKIMVSRLRERPDRQWELKIESEEKL